MPHFCHFRLGFAVTGILAATITMLSCNQAPKEKTASADTPSTSAVERGKYLVTVMGCNDCHSPKTFGPQGPATDPTRMLSGHPAADSMVKVDKKVLANWVLFNAHNTIAVGPWGASFAANLTSDATGIGEWTFEQFNTAMRQGKAKGIPSNRMLLPPMPWPNFADLKEDDMKAIFAYLKSTPPVKNIPPAPISPDKL